MKKTILLAAMAAALPGAVPAREYKATRPAPQGSCQESLRADSALPARASTRPAPQLGTVAPNTRVPSHTATPSRRAMAVATERDEKTTDVKKNFEKPCMEGGEPDAPENVRARPAQG